MWKNTWGSHTHIHAEKLCFFLLLLVESEECGADITTKKKLLNSYRGMNPTWNWIGKLIEKNYRFHH